MSHRAVLERGVSAKSFLTRFPHTSPTGRRPALAILEEITAHESAPVYKIPQKTLDSYHRAMSKAMWRRLKQELHIDKERGRALIEEMRRNDSLAPARS